MKPQNGFLWWLALFSLLFVTVGSFPVPAAERLLQSPQRAVPGGPKIAIMPDLVVDAVDVSWGLESPCTGPRQATYTVKVTIRNAGTGAAVLPTWQPWVMVWSILGSPNPPYTVYLGSPPGPGQIAPGQTATLTTKLAVFAQVAPDKSNSTVGIGVVVDPKKTIAELNENNNKKKEQLKFGGAFCL